MNNGKWPSGPWDDEPDVVAFYHYGFVCIVKRMPNLGHLCGYVVIPHNHPWFRMDYMEIDADVHGGITFGEDVPFQGWTVGFDCAHHMDGSPRYGEAMSYKDITYVVGQTKKLAEQANAAWPPDAEYDNDDVF